MRDNQASLWLNRLGQHKLVAAIVVFAIIVGGAASLIKDLNEIYKLIPGKEDKVAQIAVTTEWIIYFDYDSTALRPEFYSQLDEIIKYLNENPKKNVLLEGHSSFEEIIDYAQSGEDDLSKDESYGYEVAAKRAQTVKDMLISQNVSRSRILVKELNIFHRLDDNEDGRGAKNRAVKITIP